MSTLLAGLFCALYLTKPVHLVSPSSQQESVTPLPVQEHYPPDERQVSGFEDLVAAPTRTLDPLQGSLPGDERSRVGSGNASPVSFEPVDGDAALKPLVVDGPRKGLFVPIGSNAPSAVGKSHVAEVEVSTAETLESNRRGGLAVEIPDAGVPELVAVFTRGEGLEESPPAVDWETDASPLGHFAKFSDLEAEILKPRESLVPTASIIGEFYVTEFTQNVARPEQPNDFFH